MIAALTTAPDDLFQRAALVDQEDRTRAGLGDDVCAPAPAETGTPPFAATVESVEDRGDSLSVVVSGDGGFLIVSDTWLPGWSATLDGQPVPLIRADYAFRA
ncbi:MAG: YfhO family protein, partial [Gammaproteobacteria bacterium]|nr:YfhO family protein [Gammaproteobacteria bacterium]